MVQKNGMLQILYAYIQQIRAVKINNCMNKENIIGNKGDLDQGELKKRASGRDLAQLRKSNARKLQEIEKQNEAKVIELREAHEKEKGNLVKKYQDLVKEKEEYISMLEGMFMNQSIQPTKRTTKKQLYQTHQLVLHQTPILSELSYTEQKSKGRRALSGSRPLYERKQSSTSRHKLPPAPKPSYSKIL